MIKYHTSSPGISFMLMIENFSSRPGFKKALVWLAVGGLLTVSFLHFFLMAQGETGTSCLGASKEGCPPLASPILSWVGHLAAMQNFLRTSLPPELGAILAAGFLLLLDLFLTNQTPDLLSFFRRQRLHQSRILITLWPINDPVLAWQRLLEQRDPSRRALEVRRPT